MEPTLTDFQAAHIEALEANVKSKDAEILSLKEQVASLQRVLAHHRDSDSVVDGPGEEDGPWASGWSQIPTPEGGMVRKGMQFPGVDG